MLSRGVTFGDAALQYPLGDARPSCRAFLYVVTAASCFPLRRHDAHRQSFCSNDPTTEATKIRAFEYLTQKKFVLSDRNCRSIRAFE
jgi:hypothetical protein